MTDRVSSVPWYFVTVVPTTARSESNSRDFVQPLNLVHMAVKLHHNAVAFLYEFHYEYEWTPYS
jgi:hypothetical protein